MDGYLLEYVMLLPGVRILGRGEEEVENKGEGVDGI